MLQQLLACRPSHSCLVLCFVMQAPCSDCHGEGVFVTGAKDAISKPQRVSSDANNSCMADDVGVGSQHQQGRDAAEAATPTVPQDAGVDCCKVPGLASQEPLQRCDDFSSNAVSRIKFAATV